MSIVETVVASVCEVLETNPQLRERVRAVLRDEPAAPAEPEQLYMTAMDHARLMQWSIRHERQLIAQGLPCVGRGRALRVDVRAARFWLGQDEFLREGAVTRARKDAARAVAVRAARAVAP